MKRKGICEGCGENKEVSNKIESVFHEHNNASGVCRKVKLVGHFEFVNGTGKPKLCYNCHRRVAGGMSAGGNHK